MSISSNPEVIILPTASIPTSTRTRDESLVKSWGFGHVFTWTDSPNAHYPPHSHGGLTTHLVRRGEMTIVYPDDDSAQQQSQRQLGRSGGEGKGRGETFGVGARIDVPAGKVHKVWMGEEGCEYVIGE